MNDEDFEKECPELTKMKSVSEQSHKIGEFLDWLGEQGIVLCELNTETRRSFGGEYEQVRDSTEKLLARYFEIDLNKVEEERRKLLDYQRSLNEKKDKAG